MVREPNVNDSDEWAAAVNDMTENDRHTTENEIRHSLGMCGGPEDADD
jgi:hypothetical protein